jgi:hypothetical protein
MLFKNIMLSKQKELVINSSSFIWFIIATGSIGENYDSFTKRNTRISGSDRTVEAGNIKTASENALAELRKSDEESRKQIFLLQVWRKHGRSIAVTAGRK